MGRRVVRETDEVRTYEVTDNDGNVIGFDDEEKNPVLTFGERIAAIEAEVRGIKERAAVEAAKAIPTAKGVAEAVAAD